nr:MAG TPA: ParB protein [Caudoviricetes sp.]
MAKKQNNTLNELGVKERINLSCLELNEGQIVGIPKNPRYLKGEEHDKLKKSLKDSPELLQYKPLMVYAIEDGKFVVICGNMRLRICQELHNEGVEGFDALPCFVLNKDVPIAKIKEYAIKDNVQAGNWDWDELANGDWEVDDLQDWGVDCSFLTESEDVDNLEKKEKEENDYSDEIVSEYKLEVDCKNEETLQALYEELTGRELECRILTL